MKNLYALLVLIIIPVAGFAQFETPNESTTYTLDDLVTISEGVVTFADGAYQINDSLTISITDTLEINEDATVLIAGVALVTIQGGFYVNSNSLFTKTDSTYRGFRLESESVVRLEGATFEYGGGFKAISGNLTMIDCIVRYQTTEVATGGAVALSNGKPYFDNCTFLENETAAIAGSANGSIAPTIINSTFTGNNTLNQNKPQINLGPSGEDTIFVMDNIVTGYPEHTKAGGIGVSSLIGGVSHAVISGNEVSGNRYGITAVGSLIYTRIVGNICEDNNIEGLPMLGGSGININAVGENGHVILNNELRGNLWGITIQLNGMVNMGDLDDEEVGSGGNFFADNGNSGMTFALYNNTPNDVKAQGNCWIEENPLPNEEDVEDVIFHYADVDSLGVVDYSHFTCGVINSVSEKSIDDIARVYPNPSSGILNVEVLNKTAEGIRIYDLSGRMLKQINVVKSGDIRLNLTGYAPGVYIIQITGSDFISNGKFVIQ